MDPYTKSVQIDRQTYSLEISGISVDEFESLVVTPLREGDTFMLIYSIDDKTSFDEIKEAHKIILKAKHSDHAPVVSCGDISDLEERREITMSEGEALVHELISVHSPRHQQRLAQIFQMKSKQQLEKSLNKHMLLLRK